MAEISYSVLEKRFQSLAGLATLDSTDKFFFLNTLNSRLRDSWTRAEWPELTETRSYTVSSGEQGNYISSKVSTDVLDVFDKHPYEDHTAKKLQYNLIDGRIILHANFGRDQIFALVKKPFGVQTQETFERQGDGLVFNVVNVRTQQIVENGEGLSNAQSVALVDQLNADPTKFYYADFGEEDSVPAIFENYLISAILSDFLRGDGQHESAYREEARAEEFLLRQIDRVERLQQQNRPTVTQYNNNSPYGLIYQTTT